MQTAKAGDTVRVHYRGTLEDGSEFVSSEGKDPIEFTIGSRQVIPGLESALIGMSVGQKKTERIPARDGYGDLDPRLIYRVERASVRTDGDVEVGNLIGVVRPDGYRAPMRITELDEVTVTLDANHPLAGKTLIFELELISIA
jgi:FKBP-type peptidyl-prolyl cis-trans isomerase 2